MLNIFRDYKYVCQYYHLKENTYTCRPKQDHVWKYGAYLTSTKKHMRRVAIEMRDYRYSLKIHCTTIGNFGKGDKVISNNLLDLLYNITKEYYKPPKTL